MNGPIVRNLLLLFPLCVLLFCEHVTNAAPKEDHREQAPPKLVDAVKLIKEHCTHCHDADANKGNLNLEGLLGQSVANHAPVWERVYRKIHARQMPPVGKARPTEKQYRTLEQQLAAALDQIAESRPNPGRVEAFRRLNRTEYQNAIRDLLALEVDASSLLPPDESSHGFDHLSTGDLSPALLTRYVQAAEKISRLAVGTTPSQPDGKTYRIKPDVTQEQHVPGLPLGTRGGALIKHTFPADGEYEIQIRLMRDRNEEVEGLRGSHQVEVLIDKRRMAGFTIVRPKKKVANHFDDTKLNARINVKAGPREVGVTFIQNGASLEETKRQPLNVHFNVHRHPRLSPAVYQVSIVGPFGDKSAKPKRQTPSRRAVFIARPTEPDKADAAAHKIMAHLMRRAYRRPITDADFARPMKFFQEAHTQHSFEAGIESALSAVLTSPHFILKIERDPSDAKPGQSYAISDYELASRLSFFIWSSIPDDQLLEAAERGTLRDPKTLTSQVLRMLADPKAESLATNFAGQWLHLRNLDSITPDGRLFPDFDENLRRAMRRETELHFLEMIRNDQSMLSLLKANHTYLNERLAKHYEIPHVHGSRFRHVVLDNNSKRGGLFRHGSILTVTSYATRTSPVIRGNWILENILASPAPPPPDDVPSLDENKVNQTASVRQRLLEHRANPRCASCHNLMDPIGFSLENYDAVGRWRERDGNHPVDATGGLPDGSTFTGVAGLESAILKRPEIFAKAMTEKLLTFALGRGLESYDGPAVRRIVRQARVKVQGQQYRFSTVVLGIVNSKPFQMRIAK